MLFEGDLGDYFLIEDVDTGNFNSVLSNLRGGLLFIWFTRSENWLVVDGVHVKFGENDVVFLTDFHRLGDAHIEEAKLIQFNRFFFCILENDEKVGCKGILFFGADQLPVLRINLDLHHQISRIYDQVLFQMKEKDDLQASMLQTLLTLLLIHFTRAYRGQKQIKEKVDSDIIREFNFLLEQFFREKVLVADYAELLNKSPKTLSHIFAAHNYPPPSSLIQQRRALEAKRLLIFTNKSIKEISYELGFLESHSFSRFFKRNVLISPQKFRKNNHEKGSLDTN